MGVTAQIPENLFGTAEGRFGIDDPGVDVKTPNPGTETDRIFQGLKLWRETDLVGGDKVFEAVEKLAAKDTTEWGEAPQAFVVLARDASLTEAELIRHARDHMAHFKAPRKVEFVTELPKTATGKIQKYVFKEGSDRNLRPVNVQQAVVKLTENWSLWRQCAHSFRLPVP